MSILPLQKKNPKMLSPQMVCKYKQVKKHLNKP